jgi:pimeloyl-ACP methyl ester carboxylesterase
MDHETWREAQSTVRVETRHHAFDVAYYEDGDVDGGSTPTLFLHGIPTWGFLFRNVCGATDHHLVPDLVGYGCTQHVGPGGYDRSIRVQERVVRSLLDSLGYDRVQVVAHDIGGGVALRLACHTDLVERLVLSNGICYDAWPTEFINDLANPYAAREWGRSDVESILDKDFAAGTYDPSDATEEFVEGMKAPYLERDRSYVALSRNASATNPNHTMELDLAEVTAPTMLLWGEDDAEIGPQWADRLADDLPVEETVFLSEAKHWVMQDRPEAYREALSEFLD